LRELNREHPRQHFRVEEQTQGNLHPLLAAPGMKVPVSIESNRWVIGSVKGCPAEPFTVIRVDVEGMPELAEQSE
jgi:hypothetical protein